MAVGRTIPLNGTARRRSGGTMIRLLLPAVFCLAGFAVQPQHLAATRHSGVVRSAGQPIPGALVVALQADRKLVTTTDDSGRYVFENLTAGQWVVEVQMVGFRAARQTIQVPSAREPLEWTLEVQPRPSQAAQPRRRQAGFERLALNRSAEGLESQIESAVGAAAAPL